MINKIYKLIHNKFSRFLKFIFFIRYLFAIFFVAIVLFLTIPQFFDYTKKEVTLKNHLSENYGLKIEQIEKIKFYSFPTPFYIIENVNANLYLRDANLEINKLIVYPKLFSIYNFKNFQTRKIRLENNNLKTDLKSIKFITKNILNSNKKIFFKDLNLKIKDNTNEVVILKKINWSNYGYKKNLVEGEVFGTKFNLKLQENLKDINFKLLNTGIFANLKILNKFEASKFEGKLKGKILKSNFKLDFKFDNNFVKINNLYFRDKKLSFDSDGVLELRPFTKINLNTEIKNIDTDIFQKIDINNFLKFKNLIKRLNGQNNIDYKSQKFSSGLIDNLDLKTHLAYGRLGIKKNFSISKTDFFCESNVNLLDEFPILYFNCTIISLDKKKLLKRININYQNKNKNKNKDKNENFNLNINGNVNILNKRINFDYIKLNNNYEASEEDLKYFKETFQRTLFDKSFVNIFNLSKIKKFIEEIS